uniref:CBS domain-containing protein CBSX1, chloroplastic n=1 Tax=Anthurium amnicola TaxID=1678845 RepID=A0A1D1YGU0_9ARAE
MGSLLLVDAPVLPCSSAASAPTTSPNRRSMATPSLSLHRAAASPSAAYFPRCVGPPAQPPKPLAASGRGGALLANNSVPSSNNSLYTVGDFMTKKEDLRVVKPSTTIDEALEILVEHRITGFPVIDDDWKLVGVVSDYDLLALDSISGSGRNDGDLFPEVDSTWKTFNEIQKLLSKTNGKVIGDVMTPVPLVVRETTNLEDAARLLLETKYRRFPVLDGAGKLVGIITRGNVVRAALQMKRETERDKKS